MTSIFDVEKRLPLKKECERINKFIINNSFYVTNGYGANLNLYQIVDGFLFLDWKHRGTATQINEFLDYFDIDLNKFGYSNHIFSDTQYLYYLETLINLLDLIRIDYSKPYNFKIAYSNDSIRGFVESIIENIDIILEANNFMKYQTKNSTIQFTKRDVDADSAIITVQDRDIALDILSFLDFRNENSLNEKKSIITRLYKHLEANQSTYKSIRIKSSAISKDINPYDDFFLLANKFDIRHHPKDLLRNGTFQKLDDKRTIEVLDICFRLFLRIINTSQAISDQDYINNLKSEFSLI